MTKKRILFRFEGTGVPATSLRKATSRKFSSDVVTITFSGCHDERIGGHTSLRGFLDPNLDVVGSKIASCFNGTVLSLTKLKKTFGDAVYIDEANIEEVEIEAQDITSVGFSRGAVTCFAVARHLDKLGVPMRFCANQPVPGDSMQNEKNLNSEFNKNYDLSKLRNLKFAKVALNAHTNSAQKAFKNTLAGAFHNKYFRQMSPLFNPSCEAYISVFPAATHGVDGRADNELTDFYYKQRLIRPPSLEQYWNEQDDDTYFVPKILQQKFHSGVVGRTQCSLRYKEKIFKLYENILSNESLQRDASFKAFQAKYAIDSLDGSFEHKLPLEIMMWQDSDTGKALREFIVEFENILRYSLAENELSPELIKQVAHYREKVYTLVVAYLQEKDQSILNNEGFIKKQRLIEQIIHSSSSVTLPQFSDYMRAFMKDNIIIHPDLGQYIDESETFESQPTQALQRPLVPLNLNDIKNASELAHMLYHLSEKNRIKRFPEYAHLIKETVGNIEELSEILRFLSPHHIEKTLSKIDISQYIRNRWDIIDLMDKLDGIDQRMKVWNAIKPHINQIENRDLTVKLLKPYLPKGTFTETTPRYYQFFTPTESAQKPVQKLNKIPTYNSDLADSDDDDEEESVHHSPKLDK